MKFGVLIATVSASILAAPVLADTVPLGLLSSVPTNPTLTGGIFAKDVPTTANFSFTLGSKSTVSGAVTSLTLAFPTFTWFDAKNLSVSFNGTTTGLSNSGGSFSLGDLNAGTYSFGLTGTGTGLVGGTYLLALSASPVATPVPGPAGFMVAAAGAAALAYGVRRRRKVIGGNLVAA